MESEIKVIDYLIKSWGITADESYCKALKKRNRDKNEII